MLKNVFFSLGENAIIDSEIRGKIEETVQYIKDNGANSGIHCAGGSFFDKQDDNIKKVSLVITDSSEDAMHLSNKGYYCVGLLHSGNPDEKFHGLKYVLEEIEEVDYDSFVKIYQRYAGEPWEILRTERLIIRETTVEDVDTFYELYKDPEMTRYMEGLFDNPEDEKRYQGDYIEKVYNLLGFGVWTLVRIEDGAIIGRARYSVRNGFDNIELGFLVGKKYQRQGYAYEACKAILEYGKNILLFDNVQALVKKDNEVSVKLCEKLGFKRENTVNVEENIYGHGYKGIDSGEKVRLDESHYGEYVRFIIKM